MTTSHSESSPINVEILRRVTESLISHHNESGSINVGHKKVERLMTLHGMVSHTLEAADAALILIDNKHPHMAKALARIAFEHAVTAQWSHLHPDGVESLQEKVSINYRKYYRDVDRLIQMPVDIQEAFERMNIPSKPIDELNTFDKTCNAFRDTEWFYISFRILSTAIHPSNSTMRDYFLDDPENVEIPKLLNKAPVEDISPILFTLALSCVLAIGVYEDIRRSKPFKKKVKEIAAEAGLPTMLTLRD